MGEMKILPEDVAFVYGDADIMTEEGRSLSGGFIALHRRFDTLPSGDIFVELVRGNWIPADATLIRRSCLEAVGGYNDTMRHEDYDLWLRLALRYRVAMTSAINTRVRLVRRSLSRGNGKAVVEEYTGMFFRVLGRRPEADPIIRRQIVDHLEELYRLAHPRRHEHMRRYLRAHRSAYVRYLYACSRCGLSYQTADRLRQALVRCAQAVRRITGRPANREAVSA